VWCPRRNHVCQVSYLNFHGLRFYRGSNFPFSYWFLHGPFNSDACDYLLLYVNVPVINLLTIQNGHAPCVFYVWRNCQRFRFTKDASHAAEETSEKCGPKLVLNLETQPTRDILVFHRICLFLLVSLKKCLCTVTMGLNWVVTAVSLRHGSTRLYQSQTVRSAKNIATVLG